MRLSTLESRVFLSLVLLTTIVFVWMVRGLLMPVFWAAVFAMLFQPLYLRLVASLGGRRSLAAAAATLVVIVVVLVPSALIAAALTQQAMSFYERIASGELNPDGLIAFAERWVPALVGGLERYGIEIGQLRDSMQSAAGSATQYIAGKALVVGQNALSITIMFGLMLYLLFFFFRDGERIREGLIRAIPMGDERERQLFGKIAEVSRATVKGTIVVAAVQGAIGGVLFALLGIQGAVFWGVAMGIVSLLPAVGAALIWVPAAIILFATGAFWKAIWLIAGGTLVIGLVDNLLRPILVGRETKMPDYLVLVATLGGLTVFGLAGFVAGPVIAALFLVTWQMFADEYAPLDSTEPLRATAATQAQVQAHAQAHVVVAEQAQSAPETSRAPSDTSTATPPSAAATREAAATPDPPPTESEDRAD